jgi:hypothetical protein
MTSEIPTPLHRPKEPIMSTPQTDELLRRIEQLEKALRRWKRGTLAVVLVLLLGGAGVLAWSSVKPRQEAAASLAAREEAAAERDRAEANYLKAREAVQRLLTKQAGGLPEGQK